MARNNFLYSIIWIALLVFIAWPVAAAACLVWLVLQPFETILGCIKDIQNLMEKMITWPRDCDKAIVDGSSNFPAPC